MATALTLVRVEEMSALELFKPGVIDPILSQIKEEVRSQAAELDISTEESRKQIASLAYKVARSKTFIDTQRKALVSEEKKRLAVIDKEGKRVWDELEALQLEVRKPLTAWEDQDKERISGHKAAIEVIGAKMNPPPGATTEDIKTFILDIENEMFSRDFEEFSVAARKVADITLEKLGRELQRSIQADADMAELVRLRAEAELRAQQEREEAIARAARERAEAAAEAERQRVAAETERREQEAARKAEMEKQAIEAERLKAEKAKADAEERAAKAEQDRIDAAKKADEDRVAAVELAEREKSEAIEAERQRVAAIAAKAENEAMERAKDKEHKSMVNAASRDALLASVSSITAAQAEAVIKAIAKGLIPNVTISY